jgi:uncharacterized protein
MLKLNEGIFLIHSAIYVHETLVISDIHIGYAEVLIKQGVLIPWAQYKDTIKVLDNIFSQVGNKKIKKIVINGDLKHEFGSISESEWRHTLMLLDYLSKKCRKIILLKGNHDKILGPIAEKRNIEIKEYEILDNILIIHGHSIPKIQKGIKTIIIGHEHPAITLREGPRVEKFKCFLRGKWKKYNLIVQPSINPLSEGTDILNDELLSPFLKQNLANFSVYIIGDKVYDFGKIRTFKK